MNDRIKKVNELIAQQLGQIIREELELPAGVIITITGVRTSADLRQAKVFLSVLPDDRQREVMSLLINSAGVLGRALGSKVTLRNIPKLRFVIDDTEQEAVKLEQLLDNLDSN